jgi:hypothetical protein
MSLVHILHTGTVGISDIPGGSTGTREAFSHTYEGILWSFLRLSFFMYDSVLAYVHVGPVTIRIESVVTLK